MTQEKAGITQGPKTLHQYDTCVVCREVPHQSIVRLAGDKVYKKCAPVAAGAKPEDPLVPMTSSAQTLCGLMPCDWDLTGLEDADGKIVSKNATIDPNLVDWPASFTAENVRVAIAGAKCCLTWMPRQCETVAPSEYAAEVAAIAAAAD